MKSRDRAAERIRTLRRRTSVGTRRSGGHKEERVVPKRQRKVVESSRKQDVEAHCSLRRKSITPRNTDEWLHALGVGMKVVGLFNRDSRSKDEGRLEERFKVESNMWAVSLWYVSLNAP